MFPFPVDLFGLLITLATSGLAEPAGPWAIATSGLAVPWVGPLTGPWALAPSSLVNALTKVSLAFATSGLALPWVVPWALATSSLVSFFPAVLLRDIKVFTIELWAGPWALVTSGLAVPWVASLAGLRVSFWAGPWALATSSLESALSKVSFFTAVLLRDIKVFTISSSSWEVGLILVSFFGVPGSFLTSVFISVLTFLAAGNVNFI